MLNRSLLLAAAATAILSTANIACSSKNNNNEVTPGAPAPVQSLSAEEIKYQEALELYSNWTEAHAQKVYTPEEAEIKARAASKSPSISIKELSDTANHLRDLEVSRLYRTHEALEIPYRIHSAREAMDMAEKLGYKRVSLDAYKTVWKFFNYDIEERVECGEAALKIAMEQQEVADSVKFVVNSVIDNTDADFLSENGEMSMSNELLENDQYEKNIRSAVIRLQARFDTAFNFMIDSKTNGEPECAMNGRDAVRYSLSHMFDSGIESNQTLFRMRELSQEAKDSYYAESWLRNVRLRGAELQVSTAKDELEELTSALSTANEDLTKAERLQAEAEQELSEAEAKVAQGQKDLDRAKELLEKANSPDAEDAANRLQDNANAPISSGTAEAEVAKRKLLGLSATVTESRESRDATRLETGRKVISVGELEEKEEAIRKLIIEAEGRVKAAESELQAIRDDINSRPLN